MRERIGDWIRDWLGLSTVVVGFLYVISVALLAYKQRVDVVRRSLKLPATSPRTVRDSYDSKAVPPLPRRRNEAIEEAAPGFGEAHAFGRFI